MRIYVYREGQTIKTDDLDVPTAAKMIVERLGAKSLGRSFDLSQAAEAERYRLGWQQDFDRGRSCNAPYSADKD